MDAMQMLHYIGKIEKYPEKALSVDDFIARMHSRTGGMLEVILEEEWAQPAVH